MVYALVLGTSARNGLRVRVSPRAPLLKELIVGGIMSVINIKEGEFEKEVLKSDKPVIVDFYADWCGPCKAMAPIFDAVSEKLNDKVRFAKLNVDENQVIAMQYGVMSIPTLIIFKDGKVAETLMGLQDEDSLIEKLNSL